MKQNQQTPSNASDTTVEEVVVTALSWKVDIKKYGSAIDTPHFPEPDFSKPAPDKLSFNPTKLNLDIQSRYKPAEYPVDAGRFESDAKLDILESGAGLLSALGKGDSEAMGHEGATMLLQGVKLVALNQVSHENPDQLKFRNYDSLPTFSGYAPDSGKSFKIGFTQKF